jgi:dipeptidyl aminopeptidase/acylaminoacyl peptidase
MGGIGALLAAAAEPRVAAVVAVSSPADPYRLTRQTFRLARLPLPGPFAYPLAWLTTHVFLEPRGHTVRSISAARAAARYRGPVLLIHGDQDRVVPIAHLRRLARSARRGRAGEVAGAPVDALELPGADHSWLYEIPAYRATIARFLAGWLAGPTEPDAAARAAVALDLARPVSRQHAFSAIDSEPGGLRTLLRAIRAGGASGGATGRSA